MEYLVSQLKSSVTLWLATRLLLSRRSLFGGSAPLAFLGVSLGVAALVVSMAVFSGFESTLMSSVADVSGHIQVVKRSRFTDDWMELTQRLKNLEGSIQAAARFVFVEAVTARQGQISGVLLQGVDKEHYSQVLNFQPRAVEGSAQFSSEEGELPRAFVGMRLAQKMGLKIGDQFKIVIPLASALEESQFERRVGEFKVAAILDLGKFEWNERVIITDLASTQKLAEIGNRYSGLVIKLKDLNEARDVSIRLSQKLGAPYWVKDWRESNENLFDAVIYEKRVIFFVVLIIVIVAAFNMSSTIFVNVMQRFSDIAVLKTLGLTRNQVIWLFSAQGTLLGVAGFTVGTILGWILCKGFVFLQHYVELIPGAVYKVDRVIPEIRFADLSVIFIATVVICYISSLAPAIRGAKLEPVEGLRHG